MTYPAVTSSYAALFGLLFVALSVWVSAGRFKSGAHHGDGAGILHRRIRIHANFAEYVPLALLLVALLEVRGAATATVHLLLVILLVSRLIHPLGMLTSLGSTAQYALRAPSILATWGVIVAASLALLIG